MAVSFDLFGTLVAADRPASPADAVARELAERGVSVPTGWTDAYAQRHLDAPDGAESSLPKHVCAALDSRGATASRDVVREAVAAAFDSPVETRPGAVAAVEAAAAVGPVGVLSNCSVPGLVSRALARSDVDRDALDAVVASVDCGWRKPDPRAFEALADRLGVPSDALVHVGDDQRTDGGVEAVGGESILIDDDGALATLSDRLRTDAEDRNPDAEGSPCR